jgi:hypothetical protein
MQPWVRADVRTFADVVFVRADRPQIRSSAAGENFLGFADFLLLRICGRFLRRPYFGKIHDLVFLGDSKLFSVLTFFFFSVFNEIKTLLK